MFFHNKIRFVLLSAALLFAGLLLIAPATAIAQAPPEPVPPVDGIKVAPALSPETFPTTSEIPTDISSQFALDRNSDGVSEGMAIGKVRSDLDDVYYLTDGNYQTLAILHSYGQGIILVDAPEPLPFSNPSPDPNFNVPPYDIVTVLEDKFPGVPVTHMIYSHGHTDHIGGAKKIKDRWPSAKIISHILTRKLLKKINDPRRPAPRLRNTFLNKRTLRIGGQKIELHYFGNIHQAGNTYIYLPRKKVLMVVDVVYPGWVPFRRLALSENIRGWLKGHDTILKFDFKTLVPGHLTILGDDEAPSGISAKQHVIWAKQYNDEIAAAINAGYRDISTLFEGVGVVGGVLGNPFATAAKWALFSAFYDASTQRCVEALKNSTSDWKGKLAGEETFNFSNCEAYFVAARLGDVEVPPAP